MIYAIDVKDGRVQQAGELTDRKVGVVEFLLADLDVEISRTPFPHGCRQEGEWVVFYVEADSLVEAVCLANGELIGRESECLAW